MRLSFIPAPGSEPFASLALAGLRVALAVPFFRSGLTKWDGLGQLSDSAIFLFQEEFRLHLGFAEVPYPFPAQLAFAAGTMEIMLPILLVLGLCTRLAGLGLLGMTAIIQLTIPDGWANFHLPWAAMALSIAVFGGGRLSLDALACRLLGPARRPVVDPAFANLSGT